MGNVLMPYAFVRSVRFNLEIRFFISSMGTGDPAAIPVLKMVPFDYGTH
jgi:hypothetical protein